MIYKTDSSVKGCFAMSVSQGIWPRCFALIKSRYVLDYSKLDYEGMVDHLLNIDYSSCLYCTDVEVIWCNLSLCQLFCNVFRVGIVPVSLAIYSR